MKEPWLKIEFTDGWAVALILWTIAAQIIIIYEVFERVGQ